MKTDQQITLPERYAGCTPGPFRSAQAKYPVDGAYDWAILDAENRIIGEVFGRVGKEALRDAEANGRLFADSWTNAARVAELEACLRECRDAFRNAIKAMGACGMQDTDGYPRFQAVCRADEQAEAVLAKGGV